MPSFLPSNGNSQIQSSLLRSTGTSNFSLGSLSLGSSVTLLKDKICICCAPTMSMIWQWGDRSMTCFLSVLWKMSPTPWVLSSWEAQSSGAASYLWSLFGIPSESFLIPPAQILAQRPPPPLRRPAIPDWPLPTPDSSLSLSLWAPTACCVGSSRVLDHAWIRAPSPGSVSLLEVGIPWGLRLGSLMGLCLWSEHW